MRATESDLFGLCTRLHAEGLIAEDWRERLRATTSDPHARSPWYVRAMIGFGAWLASLLLIGFIFGIRALSSSTGFVVTGATLVVVAVAVRRTASNDFTSQLALALSLAGQGLLAFGVAELAHGIEPALLTLLAVNALLIVAYPDAVQRVLAVLAIAGAGAGLLYAQELQGLLPLLSPGLALAYLLLSIREGSWRSSRHAEPLNAVGSGLLLAGFGCVLLSAIYLFPELTAGLTFYPRPWLSTLAFGGLLLVAERHYMAPVYGRVAPLAMPAVYGLTIAVTAASAWAPGVPFALLVVLLGTARGDRTVTGAGLAFLVLFLAAYFYGMETDMLTKSMTLVGTGVVVLIARHALARLPGRQAGTGDA